tara:strand:- start:56 stop:223 length:168 start_codon:yes stop_codon:yes gene_type:complete
MCRTEDILYWAHDKGIKNKVLNKAALLGKDDKFRYSDFGDRLEVAYYLVVKEEGL